MEAAKINQHFARHLNHPGWRRFFLALSGLGLAFFLALSATGLREEGRYTPAAATAAVSLLLAGVVAAYVVPYLARRTALRRWTGKVEYEVTREGLVYLLLIAAIVVAALNTGNNLLFIILACLLSGIVVSGILSRIVLSEVGLELKLPEHLFAERPVETVVTVENFKRFFTSFSMTVSTPSPRPPKPRPEESPPSPTGQRQSPPQILNQPVYFAFIPRRSSLTRRVALTFPRRGRYAQGAFRLSTRFPFGLLRKSRVVPARQEILVLPNVRPTEAFHEILPLLAGELESFNQGSGDDLYAIRDYQATDSARQVDWKATAKAQQLKVREFTREDERRVTLVFDGRFSATEPTSLARFEKAVTLAACVAWHLAEIDAPMRFLTQGLETPVAPAGEIVYAALEALATVEPIPGSDIEEDLLERVASDDQGFNIIFTGVAGHLVPAGLGSSSQITFVDSLR